MTAHLRNLRRLASDTRGATIVEFTFVMPIFFTFVFGIFDIGYLAYNHAMLEGAVQAAGRQSGLEGGASAEAAVDQAVTDQVTAVMPAAELTFDRRNYNNFSDVGTPEDFNDANSNGQYNSPECFTDANGNNQWDADVGATGQGGADDVVVYTVNMSYRDIFPLWKMLGMSDTRTLEATTILRNQPFSTQAGRTTTQVCP